MSTLRFVKMHGCGNDYVYLDGIRDALPDEATLAALAQRMSDRHTGVGSDGLIVLAPPSAAAAAKGAEAQMVMFNADGSRSEMCGNGLRCTAKLAWDHGHLRGNAKPRFETGAGILDVQLQLDAHRECRGATIRMGVPRLTPAAVPVLLDSAGPVLRLSIPVDGVDHTLVAVGMGNPHVVCFVPDPDLFPVHEVGPCIENHLLFPRRTNVEFVARLADEHGVPVLRQRTWERGAGETQACGTGACAVTVAAILTGVIAGREAIVRLNGGDLHISWANDRAEVVMSGPAETVFAGEWPLG